MNFYLGVYTPPIFMFLWEFRGLWSNVGANLCVRPQKGRHAGLPLPHEIQKTHFYFVQKLRVDPLHLCSSAFYSLLGKLSDSVS